MSADPALLEPVTRGFYRALLGSWEEGMHPPIRVTQTLRSFDEQLHLWQQGRRLENGVWVVVDPGRVVTKAAPGESPHNFGAAFDLCFHGSDPYLHAHEVDHGEPDPLWAILGEAGAKCGLVWGGNWKKWKDRPHFERLDWRALRTAA